MDKAKCVYKRGQKNFGSFKPQSYFQNILQKIVRRPCLRLASFLYDVLVTFVIPSADMFDVCVCVKQTCFEDASGVSEGNDFVMSAANTRLVLSCIIRRTVALQKHPW